MNPDMRTSPEATAALINAGTNRQGAKVRGTEAALIELRMMSLIGEGDGLTRFGTIARQRAVDAAMDSVFG